MMTRPKSSPAGEPRRHAYVMLAVLVCLVVTGLAMVTLARRSMRLSTTAIQRQRELQQRWGTISCQRTMLPVAPALFAQLQEQATDPSAPAPATLTWAVNLGDSRFELLLADENAKLNLNSAYHYRGRAGAERLASRSARGMLRPPVRLDPEAQAVEPLKALLANEGLPIALHSWGQVFDFSLAAGPGGGRWTVPQWTSRITLWGQGQLNVRRASDETIIDACQLVVSQGAARRLLKDCRGKIKHQVDRLVERLNVDRDEQMLLKEMLSEHSSCFSLWTTVHSTRVVAQRFAVLQVDAEGVSRTTEFVF